jgi:hypothetical protein
MTTLPKREGAPARRSGLARKCSMSRQARVMAQAWWMLGGRLHPAIADRPVSDETDEARGLASAVSFALSDSPDGQALRQLALEAVGFERLGRKAIRTLARVGRMVRAVEVARLRAGAPVSSCREAVCKWRCRDAGSR